MGNYIISLKHTNKTDRLMTLWRPDNSGYCYSKKNAGVYEEIKKGYHDSAVNLPIECDKLENIMIQVDYDGSEILAVPNCSVVWEKLGLRWRKGYLEKK